MFFSEANLSQGLVQNTRVKVRKQSCHDGDDYPWRLFSSVFQLFTFYWEFMLFWLQKELNLDKQNNLLGEVQHQNGNFLTMLPKNPCTGTLILSENVCVFALLHMCVCVWIFTKVLYDLADLSLNFIKIQALFSKIFTK